MIHVVVSSNFSIREYEHKDWGKYLGLTEQLDRMWDLKKIKDACVYGSM